MVQDLTLEYSIFKSSVIGLKNPEDILPCHLILKVGSNVPIKLKYKNKEYKTIEGLQREHKNMVIESDFDNFVGTPPSDHHPSKLCHQVIAENIINNIQKDLKHQKELQLLKKFLLCD